MALSQATRLRQLLGEEIPEGESAEVTMFSDEEIADILLQTGDNLTRAAYTGWLIKAGKAANLVSISEGNALRAMSDLHTHAMGMVKYYESSSGMLTTGRARVGRVRRRY